MIEGEGKIEQDARTGSNKAGGHITSRKWFVRSRLGQKQSRCPTGG